MLPVLLHMERITTLERRGRCKSGSASELDLDGWVELELAKGDQGHSTHWGLKARRPVKEGPESDVVDALLRAPADEQTDGDQCVWKGRMPNKDTAFMIQAFETHQKFCED